MSNELAFFLNAILQDPVPALTLLPPIFILYGTGKPLGLPLLFWHENRAKQALAGAATTGLAGQVLFVTYLLAGGAPLALPRFFVVGGVAWAVIVGIRAALQEFRFRKREASRQGTSAMSARRSGLAPAMRQVEGVHTSTLASVQVSSIPFLLGTVAAGVLAAALIYHQDALERSLGRPLFDLVQPLLFRVPPDPALHGIAAAFFFLFVVLLCVLAWVPTRFRTPALDICVLLAMVAAGYGFLSYHLRLPGLILFVLIALVFFAGLNERKIRVPALATYESRRVTYPPALQVPSRPPAKPEASTESPISPFRFRSDGSAPSPPGQKKRAPLVLVCASGGGIRAASWTAAMLAKLDQCPGFRPAARMVAGASGGMMGAASWVGTLRVSRDSVEDQPAPVGWEALVDRVSQDSLSDVARQLVFRDIPYAFLPFTNPRDRGWALEQTWKRHLGEALELSFQDLEAGEKKGWWPSLVFSPMLVEDGRRLLMTNLDMRSVSTNEVRWLAAEGSPSPATYERASVSGYQFVDLFPEVWPGFPVSTAARLSAAFPYASPAAVLPTVPRRRIVDAGYYDNYGVDLVSAWLRETVTRPSTRQWLQESVSRILVVQIRDSVSELAVNPDDRRRSPAAEPSPLEIGLEGLTSPIAAALAARESVMLFRNDGQLEAVTKLYNERMAPGFVSTTIFELKGEASLSWYLTGAEIDAIKTQVSSKGIEGKIDAVARWLSRETENAKR